MGPLSVDLRKRVVSAVREEGMSCRAAAQRFGVSFSSAICWVAALRERGSYLPGKNPHPVRDPTGHSSHLEPIPVAAEPSLD